jgi:hypothetical protein
MGGCGASRWLTAPEPSDPLLRGYRGAAAAAGGLYFAIAALG